MENREHSACRHFVDYVTGELSEVESKRFERHLESCSACRENALEWRLVWDRLADDAEPADLPPDLKDEVLAAAFGAEHPSADIPRLSGAGKRWKLLRRMAVTAAIAFTFVAGFVLRGVVQEPEAVVNPAAAATSQIEKIIRLETAADSGMYTAKSAYGVACLLRSDDQLRLVVYTFGTKATEGDSVYHVWLLKDGNRSSAGTFKVDRTGIGLLTVPWSEDSPAFDSVGVTLEPDANSTSPRGQRMFKSV